MAGAIKNRDRTSPNRPHYIKEWAESVNLRQVDLANAIGADKGLVSRWFSGASPTAEWQAKLAVFFKCTPEALFRSPGEAWFVGFFSERTPDEMRRIKAMLEAAFPRE